jgi:hypothetical protein
LNTDDGRFFFYFQSSEINDGTKFDGIFLKAFTKSTGLILLAFYIIE